MMTNLIRSIAVGTLLAALAALAACGSSNNDAPPNTAAPGNDNDGRNPVQVIEGASIHITTEGRAPVLNTEDYLNGTVTVFSASGETLLQAPTQVRGRGNTTWGFPKKPYRLKLNKAASMLGMPAERDWNLLAHYNDKTLVRNKLAMNLGEKLGLIYSPHSTFVELYFNDEYQGVYEVFEHVETGLNRVNVEALDKDEDTDLATIAGGYLMEVDHRLDEEVCWETNLRVPLCFKDPEYEIAEINDPSHPSSTQFAYITSYLTEAEASLSASDNSYQDYFDVDAAVNFYLIQELLKNNDAQINSLGSDQYTSSVFLHKRRDGKLTFGPLWDFDLTAGNINYNDNESPTGWYIRNGTWHNLLFANTDFGARVFAKWCALKSDGTIDGLANDVDATTSRIARAAINRNFERWDILGTPVWNHFVGETYDEEVDYLKRWLAQRADWMHNAFTSEYGACPAT